MGGGASVESESPNRCIQATGPLRRRRGLSLQRQLVVNVLSFDNKPASPVPEEEMNNSVSLAGNSWKIVGSRVVSSGGKKLQNVRCYEKWLQLSAIPAGCVCPDDITTYEMLQRTHQSPETHREIVSDVRRTTLRPWVGIDEAGIRCEITDAAIADTQLNSSMLNSEHALLFRVLHCIGCQLERHHLDNNSGKLGYVQGMNFMAAFLLHETQGDDYTTFRLLMRLLYNPKYHLGTMYADIGSTLLTTEKEVKALAATHVPSAIRHLESIGLEWAAWLPKVLFTLFSAKQHTMINQLQKLWQFFFEHGWEAVILLLVAIIRTSEKQILAWDLERVLEYLQEGIWTDLDWMRVIKYARRGFSRKYGDLLLRDSSFRNRKDEVKAAHRSHEEMARERLMAMPSHKKKHVVGFPGWTEMSWVKRLKLARATGDKVNAVAKSGAKGKIHAALLAGGTSHPFSRGNTNRLEASSF